MLTIFSSVFSSIFSRKLKSYERKVEELREALYEFESGTVPLIRAENDDELIDRAKDYIKRFKNQAGANLKNSLLPLMERFVSELEEYRDGFWYKILRKLGNRK